MKAYIAGPMRGYLEFNFPAFDAVAALWRARGNEAVNPADHDRAVLAEVRGITDVHTVPGYAEGDLPVYEESIGHLYDLLTWDVARIAEDCDAIVMLPGWQQSFGAKVERFVAESTGKTVILAVESNCDDVGYDFIEDPIQKRLAATFIELDVVPAGFVRSVN